MLIGLCGPSCAGKGTVVQYLTTELGFTWLEGPETEDVRVGAEKRDASTGSGFAYLKSQSWEASINVVMDVGSHHLELHDLLKRPYFLLVYVDAPVLIRYSRAVRLGRFGPGGLGPFIQKYDNERYSISGKQGSRKTLNGTLSPEEQNGAIGNGEPTSTYTLSDLESMSRLRIVNNFKELEAFRAYLRGVNFTASERLRPSWDTYFMSLAKLAAERTNCMKRRVGCVIARNKRIVATGYNGTPSGVKNCFEGGCGRCNGTQSKQGVGLDLCLCLHAEENAIIEAGRERCEGSTLYTNLFPCILCSKKIVQAGVARVVFDSHYASDDAAQSLLKAGSVVVDSFEREDVSRSLGSLVSHGSRR